MKEWGSLNGPFPVLASITEVVNIKHAIYATFTRKMTFTTENWTDKTEFFLQDGVNRLKNAMRWQCRRLHIEIPNFGEPT